MIDNVMIGGLGDTAISAVGIANKLSFVYILFLFGVNSGASVFSAQFWGKEDLVAVRKVLGISLRICLVAVVPFFLVSQFLPRQVMTFFIRDARVIEQGVVFLRIIGWSYVLQSISAAYAIQSRGVGRTRPAMYASVAALGLEHGPELRADLRAASACRPWASPVPPRPRWWPGPWNWASCWASSTGTSTNWRPPSRR